MKRKNLIGERFGRLLVVDHFEKKYWNCLCDCGVEKNVREDSLEKGTTRSCGCLKREEVIKRSKNNYKDLVGKKFTRLTVIKWLGGGKWQCKCDCGNDKIASTCNLNFGGVKSCGCLCRRNEEDLTGKQFGLLTVVEQISNGTLKCVCRCGNNKIVATYRLKKGHIKSCGCQRRKHGFWDKDFSKGKAKFYKMWQSLKARCDNPNLKSYDNYGGRDITYDPRWSEFLEFKGDMYLKYLYAVKHLKMKNASIERKDVNGNYCKENCTFVEFSDQMKNTRSVREFIAISPEGVESKERNVSSFCEKHKLNSSHVYECLNGKVKKHHGWAFKNLRKVTVKRGVVIGN